MVYEHDTSIYQKSGVHDNMNVFYIDILLCEKSSYFRPQTDSEPCRVLKCRPSINLQRMALATTEYEAMNDSISRKSKILNTVLSRDVCIVESPHRTESIVS